MLYSLPVSSVVDSNIHVGLLQGLEEVAPDIFNKDDFLFHQMVFFMVLCIIDIICCIVQTALAGIAFLIWQILKAIIETKCDIRNGHCDCGSNSIPMECKFKCHSFK